MNSAPAKTSRSLWPHAIIAWFVVFASALAAWVSYAVRQNPDLVRPDYYEEEIRYQQQLERLNRTAAVPVALDYDAEHGELKLRLPREHAVSRPVGRILCYRPSDAALDFEIPMAVDDQGRQAVDVRARRGGLWRVRVQWKAAGQDYFFEQSVVFVSRLAAVGFVPTDVGYLFSPVLDSLSPRATSGGRVGEGGVLAAPLLPSGAAESVFTM
ncbi:MAG TPA: FixH family protein [Candidatus Saccharimonadales bacterium]|nr:FixH family protein [Candidatus Saccharimonadales bacterium]